MDLEALSGAVVVTAAALLTVAASVRAGSVLRVTTSDAAAERWLRAALLAMLMVVTSMAILGALGMLSAPFLGLAAWAFYVASLRAPAPPPRPATPRRRLEVAVPAALTAGMVAIDLAVYLPAPPISWDAMTYHLYLPARWLQEGHLFHIPTVFGDNAAAFAPQNGALYFGWLMALSGHDALITVSQLACLSILTVSLYLVGRQLDLDRAPVMLSALLLIWLLPIRTWVYSANVDIFMIAFWFAALNWQLLYLREPETRTLLACGLASGLAIGTKVLGLPLVLLSSPILVLTLLRRGQVLRLGAWLLCVVLAGGWWYLQNLWRTGNPLFPLEVSFAGLTLAGAYDRTALTRGEFHLDEPALVVSAVFQQFGSATSWLMIVGLALLGIGAANDAVRARRFTPAALFGAAVVWAVFFATVNPHNQQVRFLIPTLVLSLLGWAGLLHRVNQRSRWAMLLLWLAVAAWATQSSRPWQRWSDYLGALAESGIVTTRWLPLAILCALLAGVTWLSSRGLGWRRIAAGAACLVSVALLIGLAASYADQSRVAFLTRADFRHWAPGYLPFAYPDAAPLRIAYSGSNVPYTMMGPGWRSRVVYVNTQGETSDDFYEFWDRDGRRKHDYHKPGIYRGRGEYETWLDHLEQERIDLLVVFALHPAERSYLRSTPTGFPIEQDWAQRHPERFEPVATSDVAEIYRFVPAN